LSENKSQAYKIAYNQNGIAVEAPTKQECIDLFNEASKVRTKSPIEEAIR
jgi:hypothetical protein